MYKTLFKREKLINIRHEDTGTYLDIFMSNLFQFYTVVVLNPENSESLLSIPCSESNVADTVSKNLYSLFPGFEICIEKVIQKFQLQQILQSRKFQAFVDPSVDTHDEELEKDLFEDCLSTH